LSLAEAEAVEAIPELQLVAVEGLVATELLLAHQEAAHLLSLLCY
jgi:hypothetical protein